MAKITYIAADGSARTLDVADGESLMEAAVANGVPGIDGDCGGNCACATCHVHVDAAWLAAAGEKSDMEAAMLDFAEGVTADSRLACQIMASAGDRRHDRPHPVIATLTSGYGNANTADRSVSAAQSVGLPYTRAATVHASLVRRNMISAACRVDP